MIWVQLWGKVEEQRAYEVIQFWTILKVHFCNKALLSVYMSILTNNLKTTILFDQKILHKVGFHIVSFHRPKTIWIWIWILNHWNIEHFFDVFTHKFTTSQSKKVLKKIWQTTLTIFLKNDLVYPGPMIAMVELSQIKPVKSCFSHLDLFVKC